MPMDRRLQLQNYSFVLLEQIVIFAVLVDTIPTVLWARTKWGSRIKSGRKTYKKMLFNPGKIISFQTLIRTTTLNSFYASTFGGHLPPVFRGHFNRFFHFAQDKNTDSFRKQQAVPRFFSFRRFILENLRFLYRRPFQQFFPRADIRFVYFNRPKIIILES